MDQKIPVEWPKPFAPDAEGPNGRPPLRRPAPEKSNTPKGQGTFVTRTEFKRTRTKRIRHGAKS